MPGLAKKEEPAPATEIPGSDNEISEFDAVILGSGAAGMAAAITASLKGLSVVILEKTDRVGGSTAVSGGAVWIPDNPLMGAAGHTDSRQNVMQYLETVLGNRLNRAIVTAFLDNGPRMVQFFSRNTAVRFTPRTRSPDYQSELAGASMGGRTIDPMPFDGRQLGRHFELLRPPLESFMVFGGMMVSRPEIATLLNVFRSARGFAGSTALVLRYLQDRLRFSRGTRLILGNALAARLYKTVLDQHIPIILNAAGTKLLLDQGAVRGVTTTVEGVSRTFRARRGVVIATGGFPGNHALLATRLPHASEHRTVAPSTNRGDGIELALDAGAHLVEGNAGDRLWAPVSHMKMPDGEEKTFPHLLLDRPKPGLIAVDARGQRFVNEACSYHDFVEAMQADGARVPAYLICDFRFIRKYGLGLVRPLIDRIEPFVRAGYLVRAGTIAELARQIGADPTNLAAAIAGMNRAAKSGVDDAFGKGATAYNRNLGDPDVQPNPCLGPIDKPPFFALKVWPGDIGTATGLETDHRARVVDHGGAPIEGLYACGNDMNSIMAGSYPAAGITLGPALTFGYIAGLELAGVDTGITSREGNS
jgi:predicted oxidoreductase